MNITIAKAENGWVVIRWEGTTRAATSIATDATLLDVVRQVAGISPLADVPQTVEVAESIFQPRDVVECVNADDTHNVLVVGQRYTVIHANAFKVFLEGFSQTWSVNRFRKVEPAPAPAPETDEEVPGEAEAWNTAFPGGLGWHYTVEVDPVDANRFRAALRVAIEAHRKKRGVGRVITKSDLAHFYEAYERTVGYNSGMRAALATLGITVED